jgi:uncharacterized repeat protein (TIGR03803 family)
LFLAWRKQSSMRRDRCYILAVTGLAAILIWAPRAWAAPKYKVLHAFTARSGDGGGLWSSVIFDRKGNLYGTTSGGGEFGYGTIFRLSPGENGAWRETILHSFNNDQHGCCLTTGLRFGSQGELYGTTLGNASHLFELDPGTGDWHEYGLPDRGSSGTLVVDQSGNLFGTGGGAYYRGGIFELTPGSGGWSQTVLYSFCRQPPCTDGSEPYAGPILDPVGNLYGTTEGGGTSSECPPPGCGTVYQLTPGPDGTWSESVLHDFGSSGTDGRRPIAGVYMDGTGKLYGTTQGGGTLGYGAVFKLVPGPNRVWQEKVLYNFIGGKPGHGPGGGVVMDKHGTLYGTTVYGGTQCDCGVVYKLARGKRGQWKYTVLHRFSGTDGAQPLANLILDNRGNLYGTTATGGPGGAGVVFKVTP